MMISVYTGTLVFFILNYIIELEYKIDPAKFVEYGLCLEPTINPG